MTGVSAEDMSLLAVAPLYPIAGMSGGEHARCIPGRPQIAAASLRPLAVARALEALPCQLVVQHRAQQMWR